MSQDQASTEPAPVVRVDVEYRPPATPRHRARYVVRHGDRVVEVIPRKDWAHVEAYILAAAKVTGLEPEEPTSTGSQEMDALAPSSFPPPKAE